MANVNSTHDEANRKDTITMPDDELSTTVIDEQKFNR